ncbi:MAG: SH3 domain-containing protein [Spirochaetaceae bacterium]|jgi:hypothetical protein|nr:SH3 domain-containing protein [Spirochaetaceae bacterium]
MKKMVIFLLSTVIVLVPSCSKPKPDAEALQLEETVPEEPAETVLHGVLLTDAGLWEVRADGKIYWKSQLNAGDTVIWTGEQQDYRRNYDNAQRTFYRVNAEGDYWVQDYAIAGPAEPGVIVTADTILYTRPEITSVVRTGNITLPQYTLVAVFPDDNPADEFIKISARLEGTANPPVSERYIKIQNISTDPNDIGCIKLARMASLTGNPLVKGELLKNALGIARQSRYFSQTAQGAESDPVFFELEVTNNLERLANGASYMVTADTVNIRDVPSLSGNVKGALRQGDTFWITAKTKQEITLEAPEGEEKPKGVWYRAENGWIFSAYTVPNPMQ